MAEEVDFQEAKKTNIQRIFSLSSGMGWSLYRKDYRMPRSVILLTNAEPGHVGTRRMVWGRIMNRAGWETLRRDLN